MVLLCIWHSLSTMALFFYLVGVYDPSSWGFHFQRSHEDGCRSISPFKGELFILFRGVLIVSCSSALCTTWQTSFSSRLWSRRNMVKMPLMLVMKVDLLLIFRFVATNFFSCFCYIFFFFNFFYNLISSFWNLYFVARCGRFPELDGSMSLFLLLCVRNIGQLTA